MLSFRIASRRYMSSMAPTTVKTAAKDFLSFVNASPTPYHAVRCVKDKLSEAGFKEIKERDSWSSTCVPGGKYYLTRNGSTIVAFAIGKKWRPGNPIAMAGSHTDSPCLKIKPVSKKQSEGYLHVGVECYGGGIWHTWFDRDLGMAGRVMVENAIGEIEQKLVQIDKPLFRIPTLAIHFGREESFKFNKESQLFPIAGLISAEIKRQDEQKKDEDKDTEATTEDTPLKAITQRHHSQVIDLIASDIGTTPEKIVDFDITLYDVQPACLGGLADEFIYSARLDNLNQTYCLATGFIESLEQSSALEDESAIRLLACFDHEEIGSMTAQGAFSFMLPAIVRRLSALPASNFSGKSSGADLATAYEQTLATSFLLSADMAHAVHPNYTEKHESNHKCNMNGGPVIKVNANARYATNAPGVALLQEIARRAPKKFDTDKTGVPLQLFVVRNDALCGSTIGPMLSAHLGVRTLDLGNPQLSMHSCREIGGTDDVHHAIRLFNSFYQQYSKLEKTILVD